MNKENPGFGNEAYDNNGSTPEELVKKHILDPKHIVSDNEMQHMKVGDEAEDKKGFEEDVDNKEEEIENTPDQQGSNSYDILEK